MSEGKDFGNVLVYTQERGLVEEPATWDTNLYSKIFVEANPNENFGFTATFASRRSEPEVEVPPTAPMYLGWIETGDSCFLVELRSEAAAAAFLVYVAPLAAFGLLAAVLNDHGPELIRAACGDRDAHRFLMRKKVL